MTRLALGAKCGRPARPPVLGSIAGAAANSAGSSKDARAGMPMPTAVREKKCRRVVSNFHSRRGSSMVLFLGNCLVQVQNRTRHRGPGRQFACIQLLVERRLAHVQQFLGGAAVLAVMKQLG